MAKARTRSYRRRTNAIPVAVIAGFAPLVSESITATRAMGFDGLVRTVSSNLTGYSIGDHKFYMNDLIRGWTPILAGFLLHKVADRFGINRALASSGIPMLRI